MTRKQLLALLVPAISVLTLDQLTKWIIRTTPELHDYTLIEGWLRFYYTKNPGMALGIDLLSTPVISTIAILAVTGIIIYIVRSAEYTTFGYLICMSLIIGGALGNITDRIFMGLIEGDGGVLHGHVVDFIYFSLQINDFSVFPYIFNVADIAISVSIILLLIFNKRFFVDKPEADDDFTEEEGIVNEHPFREMMDTDENDSTTDADK